MYARFVVEVADPAHRPDDALGPFRYSVRKPGQVAGGGEPFADVNPIAHGRASFAFVSVGCPDSVVAPGRPVPLECLLLWSGPEAAYVPLFAHGSRFSLGPVQATAHSRGM